MASSEVNITANSSTSKSPRLCGICDENPSKYCCPRCLVFYCCLDCYRSEKHQECSEDFYRDCVNEELVGHHLDDESKQKMIEILKRAHRDDVNRPEHLEELISSIEEVEEDPVDSDDEDYVDLEDRLKDLNLDDPDAVWDALTVDERNEFQALLSQGDAGSLILSWQPWWRYCREERLVEEVGEDQNLEEREALEQCPKHLQATKMAALTSVPPSPALKFNVTNAIAAYAFVVRYFNGELEPVEASACLLDACAVLDKNASFDDPATAVESVVQCCLQSKLIETDEASLDVMKHDTVLLLSGPNKENPSYYCKSALSHLHEIFSQARVAAKSGTKTGDGGGDRKTGFFSKFPEHKRQHLPSLDVSKLKKCLKKLEYYLSFVEAYGMEFE